MVQMPLRSRLLPIATLLALVAPVPALARRTPPPRLKQLRCVPIHSPRCAQGPAVPVGLQVLLSGGPFYNGMRGSFRWSPTRAVATTLRHTHFGWVARVPARAHIGTVWVYVTDRHHRRSRAKRLRILETRPQAPTPVTLGSAPAPGPFEGSGMWIWYVSK